MKKSIWIRGGTYVLTILCLIFATVIFKAFLNGRFHSVETLREYISGFGFFAPVILVLIQALQVIIPILPGFLGCAVGAMMFGSVMGFWCNYIGIGAGSVAAFCLAKRFGTDFVKSLFPQEKYEKKFLCIIILGKPWCILAYSLGFALIR